jgi:hypothetical protein
MGASLGTAFKSDSVIPARSVIPSGARDLLTRLQRQAEKIPQSLRSFGMTDTL